MPVTRMFTRLVTFFPLASFSPPNSPGSTPDTATSTACSLRPSAKAPRLTNTPPTRSVTASGPSTS